MLHPTAKTDNTPLAPPGAGLPWFERKFAGLVLWLYRRHNGPDRRNMHLEWESSDIKLLGMPPFRPRMRERVRVPRPYGLEDSSRDWSGLMILEHLRLTNGVFARVIRALRDGRRPAEEVRVEAVKPSPDVTDAVYVGFGASERLVREAAAPGGLWPKSPTHPHPWFGELDASTWHALAVLHTRLHRLQLEAVLRARGENP